MKKKVSKKVIPRKKVSKKKIVKKKVLKKTPLKKTSKKVTNKAKPVNKKSKKTSKKSVVKRKAKVVIPPPEKKPIQDPHLDGVNIPESKLEALADHFKTITVESTISNTDATSEEKEPEKVDS